MVIGRVIGNIWATKKDEKLVGLKLLIVQNLDLDLKPQKSFVVAVDTVQAGIGDIVFVVSGSSARQTAMTNNKPVDATIAGIIDRIDVNKELLSK